jgi:hypothetical protein
LQEWELVSEKGRHPNGVLSLLIRQHYSRQVTYAGVLGPLYSWDHIHATEDSEHGKSFG